MGGMQQRPREAITGNTLTVSRCSPSPAGIVWLLCLMIILFLHLQSVSCRRGINVVASNTNQVLHSPRAVFSFISFLSYLFICLFSFLPFFSLSLSLERQLQRRSKSQVTAKPNQFSHSSRAIFYLFFSSLSFLTFVCLFYCHFLPFSLQHMQRRNINQPPFKNR